MRPQRPCFHNSTTTFAQIRPGTKRAALKWQLLQSVTLMNGRHRQLSSYNTISLMENSSMVNNSVTQNPNHLPKAKTTAQNGFKMTYMKMIFQIRGRKGRFHSYAQAQSCSTFPILQDYGTQQKYHILQQNGDQCLIFLDHENLTDVPLKTSPWQGQYKAPHKYNIFQGSSKTFMNFNKHKLLTQLQKCSHKRIAYFLPLLKHLNEKWHHPSTHTIVKFAHFFTCF